MDAHSNIPSHPNPHNEIVNKENTACSEFPQNWIIDKENKLVETPSSFNARFHPFLFPPLHSRKLSPSSPTSCGNAVPVVIPAHHATVLVFSVLPHPRGSLLVSPPALGCKQGPHCGAQITVPWKILLDAEFYMQERLHETKFRGHGKKIFISIWNKISHFLLGGLRKTTYRKTLNIKIKMGEILAD